MDGFYHWDSDAQPALIVPDANPVLIPGAEIFISGVTGRVAH
jgi:hypothetical protein